MKYHIFTLYLGTPYVMDYGYESHNMRLCEYNSPYPPMPTFTRDEACRNTKIEIVEYMTPVRVSETHSNKHKYNTLLQSLQTWKDLDPWKHVTIPMVHHLYRIRVDYEIWEPTRDRKLKGYSVSGLAKDFIVEVNTYVGEDNLIQNRFYNKIHESILLKVNELHGNGYVRIKINKISVFYDITSGPIPSSSFIQPCHDHTLWVDPNCNPQFTWEDIERNCVRVYERDYNDLIFGGIRDNDRVALHITLVTHNVILVNNLDEINQILLNTPPVPPSP